LIVKLFDSRIKGLHPGLILIGEIPAMTAPPSPKSLSIVAPK
jgi:hypothetical protein